MPAAGAPATISKFRRPGEPARWIADHDAERAALSWEGARALLDGLPGGRGLDIAHECVDRHAAGPRRNARGLHRRARRASRSDRVDRAGSLARAAVLAGVRAIAAGLLVCAAGCAYLITERSLAPEAMPAPGDGASIVSEAPAAVYVMHVTSAGGASSVRRRVGGHP